MMIWNGKNREVLKKNKRRIFLGKRVEIYFSPFLFIMNGRKQ
jgi:hypothetical protein